MNLSTLIEQIQSAQGLNDLPSWFWATIIIIALWDLVWKGIALWHAGRGNQLYWFIALLIVNSAGILPIVYLLGFKKKA